VNRAQVAIDHDLARLAVEGLAAIDNIYDELIRET
jgi:RNase P/RNase MRP subunit p30